MENIKIKKMNGGFLQIIILVIIALILLKFFGITIPGIFFWIASFFNWIGNLLKSILG